jgi:hypothetical protein
MSFLRLIFVVLSLFLFCHCDFKKTNDQNWEMLAMGLPTHVDPSIALVNMGYYILRQTHRTILEELEDGQLQTRILKKWSRSVDDKFFSFCPDLTLRFSNGVIFDELFLRNFLNQLLVKNGGTAERFSVNNQCVEIRFKQPQKWLLSKLISMENAPTVKSESPSFDLGLGDFNVQSVSSEKIVLVRKVPVPNGYNQITVYPYKGKLDSRLQQKSIEDFNRVYIEEVPEWVKTNYQSFNLPVLQSVVLVINHENPKIREAIYNCIDPRSLRAHFFQERKSFVDIGNILPLGMRGSVNGPPRQTPSPELCSRLKKLSLRFFNWKASNQSSITQFFRELDSQLKTTVVVRHSDESELIQQIVSKKREYEILVAAFDSITSDSTPIFEFLFGPGLSLLSWNTLQLRLEFQKYLKKKYDDRNDFALKDFLFKLEQEHVALPLFQEVRTFYYPHHISNLQNGSSFLQYPEIASLKL